MRWRRWWTGCVTTAPSGATGLISLKHFWKGWSHEQSSRESPYPCGREGISTPAREAVASAHREPAARAVDDEQRLRAGGRAEVPIPGRSHAELEWCCRLRGAEHRPNPTPVL